MVLGMSNRPDERLPPRTEAVKQIDFEQFMAFFGETTEHCGEPNRIGKRLPPGLVAVVVRHQCFSRMRMLVLAALAVMLVLMFVFGFHTIPPAWPKGQVV
jgi:hypothetical protein